MTEHTFTVYMATNKINGKRYIGATRLGREARAEQHFKDARRKARDCPRFYDAIRKYGREAFEWTTLATLLTSEEMYKEEERLIALLDPEYNIASGGLVFTSKIKQREFSQARAKETGKPVLCLNDGKIYPSIRATARAYGLSKPQVSYLCEHIGLTRTGLGFRYASEHLTEDQRFALLADFKQHKFTAERARVEKVAKKNGRQVTCLNTGIVYPSAMAADKALGLLRNTVSYICIHGRTHHSGLFFMFGALSEPERQIALAAAIEKSQKIKTGWKDKLSKKRSYPVIRLDTGEVFANNSAAVHATGLSSWMIYEACRSGKPTTSGLSFSYLENAA